MRFAKPNTAQTLTGGNPDGGGLLNFLQVGVIHTQKALFWYNKGVRKRLAPSDCGGQERSIIIGIGLERKEMVVQNWADVTVDSLQGLWSRIVIDFLPELVGAIIVLIVGLVIAAGLGMLVEKVFAGLRVNALVNKTGIDEYFKRGGVELKVDRFLGRLTYWFIAIAFFLAAASVLGLGEVSLFLYSLVLPFIGKIALAVLILLVSLAAANFLKTVVKASVASARMQSAKFLGALTWWTVVVLGLFASLQTLGIAWDVIKIVLDRLMIMVALAGGIAFGLGGKDYAAHLVGRLREDVHEK